MSIRSTNPNGGSTRKYQEVPIWWNPQQILNNIFNSEIIFLIQKAYMSNFRLQQLYRRRLN
jgi:hypothetical protein